MKTVLAVDGGNSKTDVALLTASGRLLAAVRGPTTSHQAVGLEAGVARLAALVKTVRSMAGPSVGGTMADVAVWALAGADTPRDVRRLAAALTRLGVARQERLCHDAEAVLRAGSDRGWGVVVICGSGVAAMGRTSEGRTTRLAALGEISGDWGGGTDVGWAGLAAAVRARDGRGPTTSLATMIPAHFGLRTPAAVTSAMYDGRISQDRVAELSPVVFSAAIAGDPVARGIADRLADEVVAMAGAMLRRLHLRTTDADVVLGGGVFRTPDRHFHARVREGIRAVAPAATVSPLWAPPVAGAALLGFDALGLVGEEDMVRDELSTWDQEQRAPDPDDPTGDRRPQAGGADTPWR